ncbi:hypothetical protein [Poseidonibacter ostreae]|jgi:hypothetical protein|uniref:Uncharacterized protein n=1 Tax=Poseidonibacter ostreae TaxID=2654171 RepID=A0A6L4WSZ3_9BACT|nr:hypothetical protein [Poseidonibacter ostreae]KAB7887083.1 hypothetical protein GA417_03395 [Poseidonibacter ostreae]KAB7889193.1 hypothetical protein GBG19_06785 [Poseidonibacter ostreae]KAB7891606.1 hypothetical protein GBG18_06455 [Poseidonibacter ostreae]
MGSLSDIVINALYQLWHLLPIVIAIVLFKKYIDNKDKKNRKNKNEENEKNGLTLEVRAIKKYEDISYTIVKSESILVCTKEDKTILIQCNNSIEAKSITDDDIKSFYTTAIKYVKENQLEIKNVEFRYAIAYKDALNKSAIEILLDEFYNCKYVVL